MTALVNPRDPKEYDATTIPRTLGLPVAAAVKCIAGGMAAVDSAGNVKPAVTATGLKIVGVFAETKDNTSGAAGALSVKVTTGVFAMNNSASGDAITNADRYAVVYAVDDNTVAKTDATGTRSVAGIVYDVHSQYGVFVGLGLATLTG